MKNLSAILTAAFLLTACGGDAPAPTRDGGATPGGGAGASVQPTGNVIEVRMSSMPGQGELFTPADFEARQGDVVRFVLDSGVHNASWPAAQNPSGVELPPTSPYLQAPGQTFEFTVTQPPGTYYYQCDPHVMMGMIGHMTVVD
jgi:plastocyanin